MNVHYNPFISLRIFHKGTVLVTPFDAGDCNRLVVGVDISNFAKRSLTSVFHREHSLVKLYTHMYLGPKLIPRAVRTLACLPSYLTVRTRSYGMVQCLHRQRRRRAMIGDTTWVAKQKPYC
ncbi:hypothetical protein H112_04430 [Trichophyton rubrum D6]|uniref:Uncharacterized protein n=2 Tax=Trichophyton rubrum TaxID=5551 RepID=A0A080WGC7_TRIRC|nr:uncharacterized protein TERG_12115 [Trichophyton rubrum CBS 118892]EZF22950.1 hypothetical protein H100_04439 [Trichophyton rubrum MR850]EZF41776.1 hypothetical protein H102_04423 [Trichophyton rubrum CBS 100081]EZF52469.1 hypothetical protein H103_04433 [Trichophyton rubrum CBS 288.86]EZF63052.1 hypothetical protein H104_04422 [Trichophyton rubrum CBS 289.86]EZF84358.1 hypothetical protein H110_04425 [Trichophyton rubrum MR1448]EZF95151.1 hypothetical protein H113_04466 [Trichophyton rubr